MSVLYVCAFVKETAGEREFFPYIIKHYFVAIDGFVSYYVLVLILAVRTFEISEIMWSK